MKEQVLNHTTTDEQQYISQPKKNYKWCIVAVTIIIIALVAYYFYKH